MSGKPFSTPPWGTIPFGLTNAPTVFQALVNDILLDMQNQFIFVYIDNIPIKTRGEHVPHICLVLQHLLDNKLFVKAEKYEFRSKSATFLEFVVQQEKPSLDPAKVSAVAECPTPSTCKQL